MLGFSGGLVLMLFFPLAGRITDSIPVHIPIAVGLLIFSIGFFLIQAVDVNTTFWVLVAYTSINRVGLSLSIPSLSAAALRASRPPVTSSTKESPSCVARTTRCVRLPATDSC